MFPNMDAKWTDGTKSTLCAMANLQLEPGCDTGILKLRLQQCNSDAKKNEVKAMMVSLRAEAAYPWLLYMHTTKRLATTWGSS